VYPTSNSAVREVTGGVLDYTVHMCTIQAKKRRGQVQQVHHPLALPSTPATLARSFSRPFEPVFASPLDPSSPAALRLAAAAACAGCWRGALQQPGWRFAHWGAMWHG
jgi:hypothetical protein